MFIAACSDDNRTCSSDGDCFSGEVCAGGLCAVAGEPSEDGGSNSDGASTQDDIGGGSHDTGEDAARDDSGGGDSGGGEDASAGSACVVDTFTSCPDPDEEERNDTWSEADRPFSSIGCNKSLKPDAYDEFEETVSGTLCHSEPADFYGMTLVLCEEVRPVLEVRLTPKEDCDLDLVELKVNRAGAVVTCDSTKWDVQCLEEDGSKIFRLRMPTGSSVESWYFAAAHFGRDDVKYDYDMTFSLR